jgi:alpha-tubulin suppressor-like RCC1 family protein
MATLATQIASGWRHICVLLDRGAMRCWGDNNSGQLGYTQTGPIGDNESLAGLRDVNVGDKVLQIALGANHTCALLARHTVRCWGDPSATGYAGARLRGDQVPASAGDVLVAFAKPLSTE